MASIELTTVERQLLLNQSKILEILDKENVSHHKRCQEILERGFSIYYSDIVTVSEGLTYEQCSHVFDILDVYRMMKHGYDNLSDKSGIDTEDIKFKGFDGNNESKFMGFAEFLKEEGKWEGILPAYLNTHYPTEEKYSAMIERYAAIREKHGIGWKFDLTKEEIQQILK